LLGAAALVALAGCFSPDTETVEAAQVEATALEPDDPTTVLRSRIVWEGSGPETFRVTHEPFSHISRKSHVYLLTAYPGAKVGVSLRVHDPRMAGRSTVRLFGPARGDGGWPASKAVATDASGNATIAATDLPMGRWAIVIGPDKPASFLPRYPADIAAMTAPDGEVEYFYLYEEDGSWWAYSPDHSFEIVSPKPSNHAAADPTPGASFTMKTADGAVLSYVLEGWSKSTWFAEAGGKDLYGTPGNLDMTRNLLDIDPPNVPEEEFRYLVVESIGVGSDAIVNPLLVRAVPEVLGGRPLAVAPASACDDGAVCNEVRYADDGTQVPSNVLAGAVKGFKPTFFDPGETSLYDLEVTCLAGCQPEKPAQLAPTKHPVYFAHGFNSSKQVWAALLADHLDKIPGFKWFRFAENVDGFKPVPDRAEQLRRNLQEALLAVELAQGAPAGEPFTRINVIAHSMGGLDSRYLVGHARYNEQCEVSQCAGANGAPESCCPPPAPDGTPTTWRERVASITTLSTPHCGSSFASWGVQLLQGSWINAAFKMVAERYFGLDVAGQEKLVGTFQALSKEYCSEFMQPSMPVPDPKRSYDWACATGTEGGCSPLTGEDAPSWGGSRWLLPAPKAGVPTVFSWAGVTCVTGSCGDIVDPGLLPAYMKVRAQEGDNDGVVATASARFGIFMGVLPHDHFDWNRTQGESSAESAGNWLFGIRKEPAERFYLNWLGMLRDAGY
jgi:triacylglycerol lipase